MIVRILGHGGDVLKGLGVYKASDIPNVDGNVLTFILVPQVFGFSFMHYDVLPNRVRVSGTEGLGFHYLH